MSKSRWLKAPEFLWETANSWPEPPVDMPPLPAEYDEVKQRAFKREIDVINRCSDHNRGCKRDLKGMGLARSLFKLNPVLVDGTIRVGGRLQNPPIHRSPRKTVKRFERQRRLLPKATCSVGRQDCSQRPVVGRPHPTNISR